MDPRLARVISALSEVDKGVLATHGITPGRLRGLILRLPQASAEEIADIIRKLENLVEVDLRTRASTNFLAFVKAVWPGFIEGAHIRQMAQAFQDIADGKKRRIIVNMPPRHSKSEMTSYLFPAWMMGRNPEKKLIIATHTLELAKGFGRRIRNLMDTPEFQRIFPGVGLAEDSKAQGKWNTSAGGEFYAAGVGSAIAGRGADLLIIDDPHSEQDAADGEYNKDVWERAWTWYQQGPRQRLQPNAAIALVMTRWSLADMTEKVLELQKTSREKWHVIRFPAILPSGRQLWPEFWRLEDMENLKDELEPPYWAAQYMQDPTSDVAAIIARKHWQMWDEKLPEVKFTITCVDTAHTVEKDSDWSAWTTWGIFEHEGESGKLRDCVILLEARKERLEYPDLKQEIMLHYQEMRPDLIEIECKAAGTPLEQELRRMRLPILGFTPTKAHGSKIRRLRQVSDIFHDGRVFYPADRTWAREVIEEVAAFPRGAYDDFVDTVSMALAFLRKGQFISTDREELEEEEEDSLVPTEPWY